MWGTTNETPSKMFLGNNLRTHPDLIRPYFKRTAQEKQTRQSITGKKQVISYGQPVAVRDYRRQDKCDQCENQTDQQSSSFNSHNDSTEPPQTTLLEKEKKGRKL